MQTAYFVQKNHKHIRPKAEMHQVAYGWTGVWLITDDKRSLLASGAWHHPTLRTMYLHSQQWGGHITSVPSPMSYTPALCMLQLLLVYIPQFTAEMAGIKLIFEISIDVRC